MLAAVLVAIAAVGILLAATGQLSNLSSGDMGNLNASQLAQYAANAGFAGDDLATAVAVALAESGGNPSAVGDQSLAPTNGPAIGLWQINSAKHTEYSQTQLLDPQTNAYEAFAVYTQAGNSFSPWSTFKSGRYQAFLGQAQSAVNA